MTRCTCAGTAAEGLAIRWKRDPKKVLSDLSSGLISDDAAREVFGVVVERGTVNIDGTTSRPAELRRARLQA